MSAFGVLDFGFSERHVVVSYCFNLHFIHDVQNLFIGSFDIYIFFGDLSVKIFGPRFNRAVYFFSVDIRSSLYVLDNSPLSDLFLCKYFFSVCGLTSHSLNTVFLRSEVFSFKVSLVLYSKCPSTTQGYLGCLLCYIRGVF